MFFFKCFLLFVCLAFPGLKIGFLSSVLRRYHFPVTLYSWLKSVGNYLIESSGNTTLAQALACAPSLWCSLRLVPACSSAAVKLKEGVSLQKGADD